MKIEYRRQAEKYLHRCDANTRNKIFRAIEGLKEQKGDVRPIEGSDMYRLKIEHFRIAFTYDIKSDSIIIEAILPRGDFYKYIGR